MNHLTRILPYVWPHRRKVYLSIVFALLVAVFWSVNLSVAFPVVKVLAEGETLAEYVNKRIAAAELEIKQREHSIRHFETKIKNVEELDPDGKTGERVELLAEVSRQQSKLSNAARRLAVLNWIDRYVIPWLPGDQFDLLALILGVLLAATIVKGLCIIVQDVLVGSAVELTTMGIRKDCFRRTLALDYQTLHHAGSSDVMSRFTHDMLVLSQGLTLLGGKVVREPLKAIACIVGAFLVCWQLTLLSLLFVPLVALVFYRIGRLLKHASHRVMESVSQLYKTLEEALEGAKIIIAFGGARKHRQRFHRDNKQYYRKTLRIIRLDALTSPTTEVLGLLAAFVALLPGAYLVLRETTMIWGIKLTTTPMDFARLSLLYAMLAGTLDPIRKLSSTYAKLRRAGAAADRIFSLMDRSSLVVETDTPKPMPRTIQTIEFADVHFTYASRAGQEESGGRRQEGGGSGQGADDSCQLTVDSGEVHRPSNRSLTTDNCQLSSHNGQRTPEDSLSPDTTDHSPLTTHHSPTRSPFDDPAPDRPAVLHGVTLQVAAGETIVVVGENGSGKSTLVNLLPRFFDPQRGAVLFDSIDIRDFKLRDLRSRIGIVTQETLLFDESIYENIRYGRPEATPGEIEEAARRAWVTAFVEQLPEGFETLVGEKGSRLSGGQKQRIALARAMLRDPQILILDEATSAIDAQSERLIHEALREFVKGRTTFLITHAVGPSILDFANRIAVMHEGRLIAAGTHEELLASCEIYQRLFRARAGEQADEENNQTAAGADDTAAAA